eukprot:EG_transcript_6600
MLQIMIHTSTFHLGPHIEIAVFAHRSWSHFHQRVNASHFILLDKRAFFDMTHARAGARPPTTPSQSSANKLRIFQLLPGAHQYDMVVMLDVDVVVQADFLRLIGPICRDTLYAVSHRYLPERRRTVKALQSRNFNPTEMAYLNAKDLPLINAGQFLFRPSAQMERLFWKAYAAYKRDPLATLYEQGHVNTVFLLEGKVKLSLTHLTLLGLSPAREAILPAAYALIHVCDCTKPSVLKLAAMRRHLGTAFRPTAVVQLEILPRLWRCLDTSCECGFPSSSCRTRLHKNNAVIGAFGGHQPAKEPAKTPPIQAVAGPRKPFPAGACSACVEDSTELTAAYSQFVSQPNVSHMCEVGVRWGHTAAIALLANPTAGLTIFDPGGDPSANETLRELRGLFPSRVVHLPGRLEVSLPAYSSLVARRRHPLCGAILLPPDCLEEAQGHILKAVRTIVGGPGHVFAAGASPALPDGWAAAIARGAIHGGACHDVPSGGPLGRWCTGRLQSP